MKRALYTKKDMIAMLAFVVLLSFVVGSLAACSPIRENSLVEVENEKEQYEEMESELRDLKTIKVKCLAPEQFEKMQKKIYKKYFRHKDDREHQEEEVDGNYHSIIYNTEELYQQISWKEDRIDYHGDLFGEAVYYEPTEEKVIQEEVGKLFKLLGLKFNDVENGYVIDKIILQGDNSTEVHMKRMMDGKEISLAQSTDVEVLKVEDITITFGNNQIIDIALQCLSEVVEIKDYEEEVFVDTPQKACKLLNNYLATWGYERKTMDEVRIAYVTSKEEDGVYTLRPMAEFYLKPDSDAEIGKVFRVDLTTKEVGDTFYGCYWYREN